MAGPSSRKRTGRFSISTCPLRTLGLKSRGFSFRRNMNVSTHIRDKNDTGPKCLSYRVFVYDGWDINAKLVEWYSVASSMFKQPEIKVPEGHRVWISSVEDAVAGW